MKNFWTAVVVGLWTIFAGLPSLAECRIALVVGNGDYPNLSMLNNPPNDARLMARKLRSLSFVVIERINVNQKGMKRAIKAFGNRLESRRQGCRRIVLLRRTWRSSRRRELYDSR